MSRFDDNLNAPEGAIDLQEFSRGLMHTRPGDRLPAGYYRRGVNLELRRGYPETRRGVRPMPWMLANGAPLAAVVQGVRWWKPARATIQQPPGECVLVGDDDLWRCAPGNVPRRVYADITDATQPVELIPAFDCMLILRGLGQEPLLYDPYNSQRRGNRVLTLKEPVAGAGRLVLPPASVGCATNGRVWLKSGSDQVIASDIFEWYYTSTNVFRVESGVAGEIAVMRPYGGNAIAVFKSDGVYRIVNTDGDLSNLYVEKVYAAKGCVAGESVQQIGSMFIYLANDGVEAIEVSGTELIAQPTGSFSASIHPYFKGMSWPAASAARAVVADNYYLLAVPSVATWKLVDPLAVRWGGEIPSVPFEPGTAPLLVVYESDGLTPVTQPIDFGTVSVATDRTLVIKNEGGALATISSAAISGTGYTIQTALSDTTLYPGESATITLRFTP